MNEAVPVLCLADFFIYSTEGRLQFQPVIGMLRMLWLDKTVHLSMLIKNMQKLKMVSC